MRRAQDCHDAEATTTGDPYCEHGEVRRDGICVECGFDVFTPTPADGDVGADAVEDIARRFHNVYEMFAPDFGWTSQTKGSGWEDLIEPNKKLMRATVKELLDTGVIRPAATPSAGDAVPPAIGATKTEGGIEYVYVGWTPKEKA